MTTDIEEEVGLPGHANKTIIFDERIRVALWFIDPLKLREVFSGIVGLTNLFGAMRLDPFHRCRFLGGCFLVGDVVQVL